LPRISKQEFYCIGLAGLFFSFGLLTYFFRMANIGNDVPFVSQFLLSAPSFFHGGFFLCLLSTFDRDLKYLWRNAIICLAIETTLEIVGFRIWWDPHLKWVMWKAEFDFNDFLFAFAGIGLALSLLVKRGSAGGRL